MVARRYARVDFTWDPSGSIGVVSHFQAVPDVALTLDRDPSHQTVMAAFVLLVLLAAAQAGLLGVAIWGRIQRATSLWRIMQARHTTCCWL